MTTVIVEHGETLPLVAERLGHSGEWQALALANLELVPDVEGSEPMSDEVKAHVLAERAREGAELTVPAEWTAKPVQAEDQEDQEDQERDREHDRRERERKGGEKTSPVAAAAEAAKELEQRAARKRDD